MKTRIVSTHIWQDEKFLALSHKSQKLVLYLLTNRNIGLIPIYKLSDREAAFDCNFTIQELTKCKKEIESVDIFYHYGYYVICNDYGFLFYTGGNTDKPRQQEISQLSPEIQKMLLSKRKYAHLLGKGWAYDGHINHKSEIINQKSKKSDIKILGHKTVVQQLRKEFPEADLAFELRQMRDWQKATNAKKNDWVAFAKTWLRREAKTISQKK